jgi:ferritin-like metal-binding protein YciE
MVLLLHKKSIKGCRSNASVSLKYHNKWYTVISNGVDNNKSEKEMANKQKLEQKLGEVLGLEMAAQKAVQELSSKGLLDERGIKNKLEGMKQEANDQTQIEELVQRLSKSEGLSSEIIHESAEETVQKVSEMMQTYLGEDPDSSEALDFLCLAEGGEVSHYEVLGAMTQGIKDSQFAGTVQSILEEEKRHLQTCIQLAKQNAASEQ